MNLSNLLKIALRAILRNKTRALLTMLGIIIGISAVITMLSLGEGVKLGMTSEFSSMGTNSIMVMPARQQRGGVDMGNSTSKSLDEKDLAALKKSCPHVAAFSPSVTSGAQMVYGSRNHSGSVQGCSPAYLSINNYSLDRGLMFTEQDVKTYAKVCVIGQTIVEELFADVTNPIGQTIRFGNIPLKVIGVLKEKGQSSFGEDADDIPEIENHIQDVEFKEKAFESLQTGENYQALIDSIDTQLKNPNLTDEEIDTLLDKRQKLTNKINN